MKSILAIMAVLAGVTSALADELPVCGPNGPNVRHSESSVDPGMPGFDSYISVAGEVGRKMFASMTTAPKFMCNSGPGNTTYATSCNERGTIELNCQQIVYKDYGCADYNCTIAVSDLANAKL